MKQSRTKYFISIAITVWVFIGGKAVAQYDTCAQLKEWIAVKPWDKESAREQYDTLRLYIEKCAATDNQSFIAFTKLDGAVKLYSNDTTRYDRYREWLISVLYLNTTDGYFCGCIMSMAGTFQYGKYDPANAAIAVYRYLRSNSRCNSQGLQDEITRDSLDLIHRGVDTTIPPLDSLGLGFLLNSSGVSPSVPLSQTYLSSFTANPNPFTGELQLHFHLNRMSHCSLQLFDILGNVVFASAGRTYEEGDRDMVLDGKSLPTGTYYARISTGFGEVKTIKLIKE
jgi:hypothetical protein